MHAFLLDAHARLAMEHAFKAAAQALVHDEVPVGAAIVDSNGVLLSSASNQMRSTCDATAHAEVVAIRKACKKIHSSRLDGCILAVTLEPCMMCTGAIELARLQCVLISAEDTKKGCILNGIHYFNTKIATHKPEIIANIEPQKSNDLIKDFFKKKRTLKP